MACSPSRLARSPEPPRPEPAEVARRNRNFGRFDRGGCASRGPGPGQVPPQPELMGPSVLSAAGPDGDQTAPGQSGADGLLATCRFGVVIPVHDEERLLPAALASLDRAIRHDSGNMSASIRVVVALDGCADRSGQIAEEWCRRAADYNGKASGEILETTFRNVGEARRAGCKALLDQWSDVFPEDIWLATTDADSEVPRNWITAQLRARADGAQVWVGAVQVRDWSDRAPGTAEAWRRHDEAEHIPVHGANFGIAARSYLEAGGFQGLSSSEDRALFEQAVKRGAVVRCDPAVRVTTSGRREARAPLGFAHA